METKETIRVNEYWVENPTPARNYLAGIYSELVNYCGDHDREAQARLQSSSHPCAEEALAIHKSGAEGIFINYKRMW